VKQPGDTCSMNITKRAFWGNSNSRLYSHVGFSIVRTTATCYTFFSE
jgi:hypothetical protein